MISILSSSCHMSLLLLNETTLYYYFLSDRTSAADREEAFSSGINRWAATIPDNAKSGNNKFASTSASKVSKLSNRSGSQVPALTTATSRSSNNSVLSKSIKISQKIDVKVKDRTEPHDRSIEVVELGGLEDDDETMGIEREAALKSPPKGKFRVSSAVSNQFIYLSTSIYSFFNRVWLKNRPPSPQQPVLLSG